MTTIPCWWKRKPSKKVKPTNSNVMDERLKLDCENPFRIGNWVTDIFGHVMQIRSLRGPYATGRYIDEDGTLHEAEGHVDRGIGCIELEPEILEKLGFKKNKYGDWFLVLHENSDLNEETIKMMLDGLIPFVGYSVEKRQLRIKAVTRQGENDMYVACEFVHELQNALVEAHIYRDFDLLDEG